MRAVRFHRLGTPDVLQVEDVPKPSAGPGQLLIRIEAAGMNFADIIRRRGEHYPVPTPLPHISGSEIVGIVEGVGDGVDRALLGQRMFAACDGGGYAEYVATPAATAFPFPQGIEPVTGVALFIQGLTAALVLKESAALKSGRSVFIEAAAGGVGLLAVQLAKLYGAGTVIGGASTDDKRRLACERGADFAINYRQPGWTAKVLEITNDRGVDVVLDMSGGAVFEESFECLAPRGRVVVYGAASGDLPALRVERLLPKSLSLASFYLGTYFADRSLITTTLAELGTLVRVGRLRIDVGGVYSIDRAADAHRALESGLTQGKLIVVP
jgi:NADPH2:quinone reductase